MPVQLEKGICYAIANSDKVGVTMICDEEYPKRVSIDFLKIHDNFKTFVAERRLDLNLYTTDNNSHSKAANKSTKYSENSISTSATGFNSATKYIS